MQAKSALVSYAQLGAEEIQTVRKLFINVYTEAEGEEQCIAALSAGADGVLCAQTSAILQALAPEGEDPAIYAPRPFVVSHRGNSQAVRGLYGNYYENTVEAARAAYDQYRPDFVEIDLYLSFGWLRRHQSRSFPRQNDERHGQYRIDDARRDPSL